MKQPISLSIFFPAYNEEDNIRASVEKAIEVANESPYIGRYEIIIVNDGSRDRTGEIANRLATEYHQVHAVHHPRNLGAGAAVRSGIRAARMEYIFFTDADLQFDILELQNLLVHLSKYPVVIGYRAPRRDPLMRLLNAKGWNLLNRFFFGLRVRDIDCAFKLFRRDVVSNLPLKARGAMMLAELLIRIQRTGIAMKEVPVSHYPRVAGSSTGAKPSVIYRALKEMVSLYSGELGLVTNKQVLKFAGVGVINTAVDAGIYTLLTRGTALFAAAPVEAKFTSFLVATVGSFLLNRYWTFGVRSRFSLSEVARFYMAISASLVVNVGAMFILVHLFHLYDLLALCIATVFTFLINFTLSKLWVFRPQREAKMAPQPEFVRS